MRTYKQRLFAVLRKNKAPECKAEIDHRGRTLLSNHTFEIDPANVEWYRCKNCIVRVHLNNTHVAL